MMCDYTPSSNTLIFETWLQTDLQRLYDEALYEPVPDDLLRLVPQVLEHDLDQT